MIGKENWDSTRAPILSITGLQDPVQVAQLPQALVSYLYNKRDITHFRGMKEANIILQMMRHYKMKVVIIID